MPAPIQKEVSPTVIIQIVLMIYTQLRPWLVEQAKKTETPIDDWMITLLDRVLGLPV